MNMSYDYGRGDSRRSSPTRCSVTNLTLPEYKPTTNINTSLGRNRSATPSAAVRRALEVLDDSYKYQQDSARSRARSRFSSLPRNRSRSPYRSRSPSPYRNKYPLDITPPRIAAIERDNFETALSESETRRNVLLKKLKEAQRTMEVQNSRLRQEQADLGSTQATIKLLEQVQQELETKVSFLEKERSSHLIRQRDDAEEKELLRRRVDELMHEIKRMGCEMDLLSADKNDLHHSSSQLHDNLRQLQDDNRKLLEAKNAGLEENSALRENLQLIKERLKLMQREKEHAFTELNKNQESQQALINRNTELSRSLTHTEENVTLLREDLRRSEVALNSCQQELNTLTDKCTKQTYKMAEYETSQREIQNDYDRTRTYNSELEKTIKSLTSVNDQLKQAKATLGDNATSLHADLAKARLEVSRLNESLKHTKEDLEDTKKLRKQVSNELSEMKFNLSARETELETLEDAKKRETLKCNLLEAEIKEMKRERDDNNNRFVSLQERHHELQRQHEDESRTNLNLISELKSKINQLESSLKAAEEQLGKVNEEFNATIQHDSVQIDHWRQTCTKLTALMEEKDRDVREANALRREAESATERAQSKLRGLEIELSHVNNVKSDLEELKSENKRLNQECSENRQVISVLELQRDVLIKSPGSKQEFGGEIPEQIIQLKNDLKSVSDKINSNAQTKNDQESKYRELESKYENSICVSNDMVEELEKHRQEISTMKNLLKAKEESHGRTVMKMEKDLLLSEERISSLQEEANVLRSSLTQSAMNSSDIGSKKSDETTVQTLNDEITRLKKENSERSQDLLVAQGQLLVMENGKMRNSETIKDLKKQMETIKQNRFDVESHTDKQTADLKVATAHLDASREEATILRNRMKDLEELHNQQESLIKKLREQLIESHKDEASRVRHDTNSTNESDKSILAELNTVRRDLQRAFEDIAARDQQMAELRRKLISAQKSEQKARQERDELKGKTIIMETITDSNQDLRKEVENLRQENADLEKQLAVFCTSKTSQTPPDSLVLVEDLDKELQNQYKSVCNRNKWLENRIESLHREIELLRDQNSLLIEEKNNADHEAELYKGELKKTTMTAKSARQQRALEEIHLKNSNAEKTQEVLNLREQLREKNELLQMLSSTGEKKSSDKKKIAAFMKKLRRSSSSGNAESNKPGMGMSASFGNFSNTQSTDKGYSTLSLPGHNGKRSRSLTTSPLTSVDLNYGRDFPTKSGHRNPQIPIASKGLSPSPTTTVAKMSSQRARSDDGIIDEKSFDNSGMGDYISESGDVLASPIVEYDRSKKSPTKYNSGFYRPQPSKRAPEMRSKSQASSHPTISFEGPETDENWDTVDNTPRQTSLELAPAHEVPSPSSLPKQPSPTSISPSTVSPRSARRPGLMIKTSMDEDDSLFYDENQD